MAKKAKLEQPEAEEPEEAPAQVQPNEQNGQQWPGFPFPQHPAAPRDLLTAYMLLLLRNWNMHGYQLMQQLSAMFGVQPTDPGSIYRHLRQLERQGFVQSEWETGEAGPARRTYALTDSGDAFLKGWAEAIENYQKTLKFWSDLYAGMATPQQWPPQAKE